MEVIVEDGMEVRTPILWISFANPIGFIWILLCAMLVLLVRLQPFQLKRVNTEENLPVDGKVSIGENLDWAPARRRIFAAFQKFRCSLNHILFRTYHVNSRGVELFTKSWLPGAGRPKALICLCHGYGDSVTFFLDGLARKLASAQYAVFGMDYEGFGLSSGLHGYINNFDSIVDDVIEHYSAVKEQPEFKGLPCFLFGESMGGAVALKVHLKRPNAWTGAILVAPMCKIAADMYPPWPVLQILKALVPLFPTWKLVPNKDVAGLAFRDVEKKKQTAYNVVGYGGRPRLKTALELVRVTDEIAANLHKVSLPLLILHGAADRITDPSISKALYELACSPDKTLHLYQDAWHCILEGESDENITQVIRDIVSWLDAHSIAEYTAR
ncbi:hypothetical protein O6H91_15G081600 [Diphasiastrum complanatum]|uniref:Uncharacterized protein n=1 Tax=Diphasiastrum complanatum TaxID=34168 RepID=A0ACC2BL46_DIPCM|nr:hypothetical protein O6H91_15G081600 [Diphasiastrum complanatum]